MYAYPPILTWVLRRYVRSIASGFPCPVKGIDMLLQVAQVLRLTSCPLPRAAVPYLIRRHPSLPSFPGLPVAHSPTPSPLSGCLVNVHLPAGSTAFLPGNEARRQRLFRLVQGDPLAYLLAPPCRTFPFRLPRRLK